jgi:addiction module HigA family antidote
MAKIMVPAEVLKKEREKLGITSSNFAKDIKVSPASIQQLENGKLKISPEMALKLGKYYGPNAKYWADMESAYRLSLAQKDEKIMAGIAEIKKAKPAAAPKAAKGKKTAADSKVKGKASRKPRSAKAGAAKAPKARRGRKPKAEAPTEVPPLM